METENVPLEIGPAEVVAARERILPFVHATPVLTSARLDERCGARLFFKAENLQKIGAFKARGAHNAVFSFGAEEIAHGVVTHSSGNHAAALALAARNRGVPAFVVMPENAPRSKVESVRRLGGHITFCPSTIAAREAAADEIRLKTRAVLVHPFDDWRVIAGQGTAALELLESVPDLDAIVVPVGGGGLLSGTALAGLTYGVPVYGVEPAAADDAARSFRSGRRETAPLSATVADGLRVSLGARPFAVIRRHVADIITVDEDAIVAAMRLVWEILKVVIEPSAAVPLAGLLDGRPALAGKRVGVIFSGGNVDLDRLPWQSK